MIDPIGKKIIGGGAWNPPAIGPDGTVYIGFRNMYQPASEWRSLAQVTNRASSICRQRSTHQSL